MSWPADAFCESGRVSIEPSGHEQVVEPFGDVALLVHCVHTGAPDMLEYVFIGHCSHVFEEFAPITLLALPGKH